MAYAGSEVVTLAARELRLRTPEREGLRDHWSTTDL